MSLTVKDLQESLKNVNPELPVIIGLSLGHHNYLFDVTDAEVGSPFNRERWFIIKGGDPNQD